MPSLPLASRRHLPKCLAIYFVLEGERVIYIGQAVNLSQLRRAHHHWYKLKSFKEVLRISWLELQSFELLKTTELKLIHIFKPKLSDPRDFLPRDFKNIKPGLQLRIKELREKLQLSQRRLAQALDLTENTIANWENGRTGLEWFERVAKLCETLKCSPNELFGYEELLDASSHSGEATSS